MAISKSQTELISPRDVLADIAKAVPSECHDKIVVIGSLAVGYHYFQDQVGMAVRTKDADCLLFPRAAAAKAGTEITESLLKNNWHFKNDGIWGHPGNSETPDDKLPAVRLLPPGTDEWFLELLAEPESSMARVQRWMRIETRYGHFGLPSFGFLSIANFKPIRSDLGIYIARPEMMALANLLEHPAIGPDTMSAGVSNRLDIKRSNKDLGRVLAITRLAIGQDDDALLTWADFWLDALRQRFPCEWRGLVQQAGNGLRALLASEQDLEQALFTCANGLLASRPPSLKQLIIAGKRLLVDAIENLERQVPNSD